MATSEPLVVVNLDRPRYPQNTFLGRFRHFLQITDPRNCLVSNASLTQSLELMDAYRRAGCPPVPAAEAERLWQAKKVRDATIHSDTGQKVPLPVRLAAFVPTNVLICAGMLAPDPSIRSVVFWQWVNQTYNIALNHANRNASNELSTEQIAKTYAAAVGISCTVAVGLGQLTKAIDMRPSLRAASQRFVPFTAVATAGVANVFLMRWNEVREGINVKDSEGRDHGKSPACGFRALTQVSISRVATAIPCLVVPPLITPWALALPFVRSRSYLHTPVKLGVITAMLLTGLPVAVALFPQWVKVRPEDLEPKFHNLKDSAGNPLTELWYNRGL